jgi:hypothetical protein
VPTTLAQPGEAQPNRTSGPMRSSPSAIRGGRPLIDAESWCHGLQAASASVVGGAPIVRVGAAGSGPHSHPVTPPKSFRGLSSPHVGGAGAVALEHRIRRPAGQPLEISFLSPVDEEVVGETCAGTGAGAAPALLLRPRGRSPARARRPGRGLPAGTGTGRRGGRVACACGPGCSGRGRGRYGHRSRPGAPCSPSL